MTEPDEVQHSMVVDSAEQHTRPLQIVNLLAQFPHITDRMALDFAALVREVVSNDAGKPGALVLTLTVAKLDPKKKLTGHEIMVSVDIKVKEPNEAPNHHLFYYDDGGGLHMQDPYQRRMFPGPQG